LNAATRLGSRRAGRPGRWSPSLAFLLALAAVLTTPGRAQASDDFEDIVAIVGLSGLIVTDVAFGVRATVLLANQDDPDPAPSWVEGALGNPQAVLFHGATAALAHDHQGEGAMIAAWPAMVTSAMTAHGVWSLVRPDEDPSVLFAGSTIVGINSVLTTLTISNAFDGDLPVEALSIVQLVTTTPSIVWGSYGLATDPKFRTGWLALTAWSGALFLYGAGALILDDGDDDWGARDRPQLVLAPALLGLPGPGDAAPPAAGLLLGGWF